MADDTLCNDLLPEVSVIVLSYNQADTVARALDSILAQQCDFPFEIVVSDDASTDGTRAVINRYAARFPGVVRVMPEAPRRGLVDNYFYTLSQCRGRFIADCAADDFWVNERGLQLKRDRLVADPALSMVCSDWLSFSDDDSDEIRSLIANNEDENRLHRFDGKGLLEDELSKAGSALVHLSTALYRRSFIDDALATTPALVHDAAMGCEDLPVKAALMSRGDVEWISTVTLCYRVGHASVSAPENPSNLLRFQLQTAAAVARLADHYGVPRSKVAENLKDKIGYAIAVAFAARDYKGVKEADALRRQLHLILGIKSRGRIMLARIAARRDK